MTNDPKTSIVDGVILGAQVIAAWAALYMLFNGKENAPKVKEWVIKMEEEIVEKVDTVKDMTESHLSRIMDEVNAKYLNLYLMKLLV